MVRPSSAQISREFSVPRWWCLATAFTTGAVVMALEILGSRLLAPVFGSSLFVWGALIGVVLAAMSSGYAAGGWLADRNAPQRVVALLLPIIHQKWRFPCQSHPIKLGCDLLHY